MTQVHHPDDKDRQDRQLRSLNRRVEQYTQVSPQFRQAFDLVYTL